MPDTTIIERHFGFANLIVETAGGGAAQTEAGVASGAHQGVMTGLANAEQLRDQTAQLAAQWS